MKEHPIIFSTSMVQAILEDRKIQTRRVIKPQPGDKVWEHQFPSGIWGWMSNRPHQYGSSTAHFYPYGQVGDRLWVKETWRVESFMEGEPLLFGYKDGQTMEEDGNYSDTPDYEGWYERVCIQSTDEAKIAFDKGIVRQDEDDGYYRWDIGKSPCRWRPSIFMPRWASRITLEITGVRVERLQEITEEDAKAEGVMPAELNKEYDCMCISQGRKYACTFIDLWDSLNAKRGYGWDTNCWVWVINFRRLK